MKFVEAQAAVAPVDVKNAPANVQDRLAEFERLSADNKAKARKKVVALNLFEQLRRKMRVRDALKAVAEEFGVSPTTVQNWRNLVKPVITDAQYWEAFLAPRYKGKAGFTSECDPEAFDLYKSYYLTPTQRSFQSCYHWVRKSADELGWVLSSPRAMQERLKREVPHMAMVMLREGRDAIMLLLPAQQRDRSMFHALQGVQGDGHKLDLWVRFPDGEVARPMIIMFSDILSSKFLGWHIAKSENTTAVRLAFRQVLVKYGIPEWVLLDNGRAFASKEFTGGQANRYRYKVKDGELNGVLTSLSITVTWASPGHGQAKPIERSFQLVRDYVAKDPRFEGAYTGNSVAN